MVLALQALIKVMTVLLKATGTFVPLPHIPNATNPTGVY
jgi:hypothetical protein